MCQILQIADACENSLKKDSDGIFHLVLEVEVWLYGILFSVYSTCLYIHIYIKTFLGEGICRREVFFKGSVGPNRNLYMILKQMSELMVKPRITITMKETEDESR